MKRRALIGSIGIGITSSSGCLRLQSEDETETEGQIATESEVTLSESASVDQPIYKIWEYDGSFMTNSNAGAAHIPLGGEPLWDYEKPAENEHNAVNAFASTQQITIFGFTGDPNAEPPASEAGAQFYGLDFGSEQWVTEFPSDGNHRSAACVAIASDIAVLGASDFGESESPLLYGVDVESGDQIWTIESAALPGDFISGALRYDEDVYVFQPNGTVRINPQTGSITSNLKVGVGNIGAPNRFADTIYYYSLAGVQSYSLAEESVNWTLGSIDRPSIQPIVDNTLVVCGTRSGELYVVNRSTGETVWSTEIQNSIYHIALTPDYVFLTDRQTGLYGYNRSSGEQVHSSTRQIGGSDIAYLNSHLLVGGEQTIYTLNRG